MKRKFYYSALALVSVLLLVGCGSKGGSKLKGNEYLGDLPGLYDGFNIRNEALETKLKEDAEKLSDGGEKNFDKVMKLAEEATAEQEALETKFKEDVKAELAKVVGKEVPVSYSASLTPWYDAVAKVGEHRGDPWLVVTLTSKEDFTVPSMKGYDYTAYLRLVNADGASLENAKAVIIPIKLQLGEQTFTAGQVLTENYNATDFNLDDYAADRVAFAGVEFITQEEFNNL